MRRTRDKGRLSDRELMEFAQAIMDRDLVGKPAELRSLLEAAARARQDHRLREIRTQRQNRPLGIALLSSGAAAAVAGVLGAFWILPESVFGALARVVFLVLGLAGSFIVAIEDPFHEDLGDEATPMERLKLRGKILVVTTLVAVLCTGLSFYTDHVEHCRDQLELAMRIETASVSAVSRLESVLLEGGQLDAKLQKLNDTVDRSLASSLKRIGDATDKIALLPTRAELPSTDDLDRKLATLATADSVRRLATSDRLGQVESSLATLATSDSVHRLATSVAALATADSVSRLATAESVGRLATAESVGRLATSAGTLATASSVNSVSRVIAEIGEAVKRLEVGGQANAPGKHPPDDGASTAATGSPANAGAR